MPYIDGFVLVVSKKNLAAYRRLSAKAGKVWRDHGALEYRECVGDDLKVKMGVSFSKLAKIKAGELVVFSWIVYKNKAQRNAINKAVMKDPRLEAMMDPTKMPFDMKKMSYGGFKMFVDA